jgi:hypothetical protein
MPQFFQCWAAVRCGGMSPFPQTSYWLVVPNETMTVKNILIIVNSRKPYQTRVFPVFLIVAISWRKGGVSGPWPARPV